MSIPLVWRRTLRWLPPLAYAVIIFHFSAESNPLPALQSLVWDKALHATEYGVFAGLLFRALRGERLRPWTAVALAFVLASTYGASDEWHQAFVAGRDSSVLDWIADSVGSALGLTLYGALTASIEACFRSSSVMAGDARQRY